MPIEDSDQQKQQQFQLLQQHLEQLSEQIEYLNQQNQEAERSIEALQQFSRASLPKEFMAPIANGIFFKGKVENNQVLLVNVGANVVLEKTVPEVVAMLNIQQTMILKKAAEADNIMERLTAQAAQMYQEFGE